jgi:antirestriction protein ArdC
MATVYEIVTDRIIKQLEAGTIPWRKPWNSAYVQGEGPVSWDTQRPYSGVNLLLLDPGEYATYNAIQAAGGHVKKGEKASIAVFWKMNRVQDENDPDKEKLIPFLRYYSVFEINTQAEGLLSKRAKAEEHKNSPIEEAERIISNMPNRPSIVNGKDALYRGSTDTVEIPTRSSFINSEAYYGTLFHELAHSTGHESRLNRPIKNRFGTDPYAKEELVAEIGAAFLAAVAGLENPFIIENTGAYIQSWIRRFRDDSRLIVTAASQAQKAADYIRGIKQAKGEEQAA